MCSQTSLPKQNEPEKSDIYMQQPFSPQTEFSHTNQNESPRKIVSTYSQNFNTDREVTLQNRKHSSTTSPFYTTTPQSTTIALLITA